MNKQRFIERLNLHLDNELSSEESEELMTIARSDPDYFRIYRQYAMINEACTQLGGEFATARARFNMRQTIYALGGMAAAAALLFMAGRNLAPMVDQGVAQQAPGPGSVAVKNSERLAVFDVDSLLDDKAFHRGYDQPLAGRFEFAGFDVQGEELNFSNWDGSFQFAQPVSTEGFSRTIDLSDVPRSFDPRLTNYSEAARAFSSSSPLRLESSAVSFGDSSYSQASFTGASGKSLSSSGR